jgi:predicted nucleic acid-binding protein
VPTPDNIQKAIVLLRGDVKRRLPSCKYDVLESTTTAQLCYAILLIEDTDTNSAGIRIQFDRLNYANVFGDMHILQMAIYLGAKVMTKDKKLERMANYANIKCDHTPQTINKAAE